MNANSTYISEDEKYHLKVLAIDGADIRFSLQMPVMGTMEGTLKGGEIANLKGELKGKAVFIYLFVEKVGDKQLIISASGRSAGRFSGDIPPTSLILNS